MNIISLFRENVKKYPQKKALIFKDESFSYAQIDILVKKYIKNLQKFNLNQEDIVAIFLPNGVEFSILNLAASSIGLALVPINTTFSTNNIKKLLNKINFKYLITLSSKKEYFTNFIKKEKIILIDKFDLDISVEKIEYNLNIDNNLTYLLTSTSGSTGEPKIISLSQKTKIYRSLDGAKDLYDLNSNDIILCASPMYHSLGFRLSILPYLIGATSVILPKFSKKLWLEAVLKYNITFTIAVSSHLEIVFKDEVKINSLKKLVSSSYLLSQKTKQNIIKNGIILYECYGTSEIAIATNIKFNDNLEKLNSVGKSLDYVDIKIIKDNNQIAKVKEIGEIICKTKTMFDEYYKDLNKTKKSLVNGYFYTKDLGYLDKDGYLYYVGRKDDMVKISGINVYLSDIENVLNKNKFVNECSVVAIEDKDYGHIIVAFLVLKEKDRLNEIKKYTLSQLASYQQPLIYEIIDKIPKNNLGKIQKFKLKKMIDLKKIELIKKIKDKF